MLMFKAVRLDGTDLATGTTRWASRVGGVVEHPTHPDFDAADHDPKHFLTASTRVADISGVRWPIRLLSVEPFGGHAPFEEDPALHQEHTVRAGAFRVVAEVLGAPWLVFGPNGAAVSRLLDAQVPAISPDQAEQARAAWLAAVDGGLFGTYDIALDLARKADREAGCLLAAHTAAARAPKAAAGASRYAAVALVTRDLLRNEQFEHLMRPWTVAGLPSHPHHEQTGAAQPVGCNHRNQED